MKDIIPCGCKPENALNKQLWFGCGCPSIGFSSFKQPIKQWDENDINDNGTVIKDYYDPYGGVSVDLSIQPFCSIPLMKFGTFILYFFAPYLASFPIIGGSALVYLNIPLNDITTPDLFLIFTSSL